MPAPPWVPFTPPLPPPPPPRARAPPPPTTARLVNEDDPWAQEPGFLAEVMVAAYERRRSQVRVWVGGRCGRWDSAAAGGGRPFHALCTLLPCLQADAISEMPLYPTEAVLFDENQVPSMHYTGRCIGAARAVAGGLCGRWWFMEAVRARMTPACMPAGPPPSLSTSRNPRQAPLPNPPPPPTPPTHTPTHPHTHTHTHFLAPPSLQARACLRSPSSTCSSSHSTTTWWVGGRAHEHARAGSKGLTGVVAGGRARAYNQQPIDQASAGQAEGGQGEDVSAPSRGADPPWRRPALCLRRCIATPAGSL